MKKRRAKTEDDDELSSSVDIPIPLDIVFSEIFSRLPVKSICRFRCVCKSVLSLTQNDPSFLDLHLSRSQTRPGPTTLVISTDNSRLNAHEILSAELDGGGGGGRLLRLTQLFTMPCDSAYPYGPLPFDVNGLLCLSGHRLPNTLAYVFNPTTGEFLKLPPIIGNGQPLRYFLGFDPSTSKFKVLHIHYYQPGSEIAFQVFTLCGGGGAWRTIRPSFPFDDSDSLGRSVCLNGGIHWLIEARNAILAFDLKDENFHVIPLAAAVAGVVWPGSFSAFLIQVKGCLAVIRKRYSGSNTMMEMWVLEDYQRHVWIKHTIDFSSSYSYYNSADPIGSTPTGEILLLHSPRPFFPVQVLCYDTKNKSSRTIEITQMFRVYLHSMTSYTESLFFPTDDR